MAVSFLDTKCLSNKDDFIHTSVNRNPTHIDQYLDGIPNTLYQL